MRLPRLHLFELEGQPWFPRVIRDLATDYLQFMQSQPALFTPMVPLLARVLRESGAGRIVDLCSGGGGPLPKLVRALAAEGVAVNVTLTDLFPNLPAFRAASGGAITFEAEPVDATVVPAQLTGLRTLFNGFHHFRPNQAAAILQSAASARQPIAVLELSQRSLATLLPLLLLTPLMVWGITPLIRPFRLRRLVWTYLIPAVPLTCWWDGIVSQLRAYTPDELRAMAKQTGAADYRWEVGQVPLPGARGCLTYLLGIPTSAAPNVAL